MESNLRLEVEALLKLYTHEQVLKMLVYAVENARAHGDLDPPNSLPRAGNWSGPATRLFRPVAAALGFPGWRK